jgi:nitrate reductase NapE component
LFSKEENVLVINFLNLMLHSLKVHCASGSQHTLTEADKKVKTSKPRSSGMFIFTVVCVGQVFSLLGTAMTGFALAVWVWQINPRRINVYTNQVEN